MLLWIKMEENKEDKNWKIMAVGLDMVDLIKLVKKRFEEEYGFEPRITDVTNMIAKRVIENKLF